MSRKLSDEERFQLDRPPDEEPDPSNDPTWQELAESYIKEHDKRIKALEVHFADLEEHGRAQGLYQALIDIEGVRGIEHVSARYTGGDPELVDYVNTFNAGKDWALNHLRNTIVARMRECGYEPGSHEPKKVGKEA